MKRLLPLFIAAAVAAGCSMTSDDGDSSNEAISGLTLTPAGCKTPAVATKPAVNTAGQPINGSAKTTINGCIVGKVGETGQATATRLAAILGDTNRLGQVRDETGAAVFTRFTPSQPTGTLATGLVQDVDVSLAGFGSPSSRLRVTRKQAPDGTYTLSLTNVTAFTATVFFVDVTAIDPGNLVLSVTMKPEANGLTVTGAGSVILDVQQDQAGQASQIVNDLFSWLTAELAK
jgi:hypothetical protein